MKPIYTKPTYRKLMALKLIINNLYEVSQRVMKEYKRLYKQELNKKGDLNHTTNKSASISKPIKPSRQKAKRSVRNTQANTTSKQPHTKPKARNTHKRSNT